MRQAVLVSLLSVVLVPSVTSQRPLEIVGPPAGVTVPMLSFGGRPVVEVKINGTVHPMILDTGASRTVIDPSWLDGATGPGIVGELAIGTMVLRNASVGRQRLFGGNLPEGMPDGVLSAAAFPGYLVTLDYPNKTVSFVKGALPAADGKRVFEYGASELLPVAPVVVAGREFVIHVDSGSPSAVMLPLRYAKELPLAGELTLAGKARTNAGEFDVFTAPVKGAITLGEFTLDVPVVRFSELRPGPRPGIGNFGYEVLKTFRLTFDSVNRRLRFER